MLIGAEEFFEDIALFIIRTIMVPILVLILVIIPAAIFLYKKVPY
jgi:hypothetical protein